MASPPPSSGDLFFSSPPRDCGSSGPDDEVLTILAKAQLTKKLPVLIATFLDSSPAQKTLFNQIFSRQVELLKSRSQSFEDGHVTVYDKVLLTLTRNGYDLDSPAAIAYYCKEYLGINKQSNRATTQKALQQSVTLPALLNQEFLPPASIQYAATPMVKDEPLSEKLPIRSLASSSSEMEAKLARLWSVYERAKADFTTASGKSDNFQTANAAKFLRDTAENTLQYLENKNTDPIMMAELNATYNMAKTTAVSLTGGKKRRFDYAEMDKVRGTPRGPSHLPSKRRSSNFEKRASDGPTKYGREYAGGKENSGRGHSGVPFGYSRDVDSYQPRHPY